MSKELTLKDCFDADSTRNRIRSQRAWIWVFVLGFCAFLALGASLLVGFGLDIRHINGVVALVFGVISCALSIACMIGIIVSATRLTGALDFATDCRQRIVLEASRRAEDLKHNLFKDVSDSVKQHIIAEGFYFNDIDTPCLQRSIDGSEISSNYQISQLYVADGCLYYATHMFSILNDEQHTMRGCVPFDQISAVELIKANGIDLFCPQIKVVFGARCMLFAVDPCAARIQIEDLHDYIFASAEAVDDEDLD